MDTETFVEVIIEMDPETLADNFEALMHLALSIEEAEEEGEQNG